MFTQRISRFASCALGVLLVVSALGRADFASAQPVMTADSEQVLQVNVNTADAETIADILVGVGMSRAEAIVQYRSEHGAFIDINDLIMVNGIGEATLESNKERIRLE